MPRHILGLLLGTLLSVAHASAQTPAPDSAPMLHTGITGVKTVTGLADPTFVLSMRPVQHVVLDAVDGPLDAAHIDSLLHGTTVTRADLVKLGILRPRGDRYAVAYLVLTREDQRAIYKVAKSYGPSLAGAFESHQADFDRLMRGYSRPDLRSELAFDLVAGMAMNWDGLKLTTEMGYRSAPSKYPNGDAYLFHSNQPGANNAMNGLYLESHSIPGPRMTFTTYGDGASIPRVHGIPDVFDGPAEDGVENLKGDPEVYGATQNELIVYISEGVADAGDIIAAVAAAPRSESALRRQLPLPDARFHASLRFLEALGYIRRSGNSYEIAVPVLTTRDKPLVDSTIALSRHIMSTWLTQHHDSLEHDLAGLSSVRAGLPFASPFSEVWHYVFGFATKSLAADGFYVDPSAPGRRDAGYVPLVWATSLYRM